MCALMYPIGSVLRLWKAQLTTWISPCFLSPLVFPLRRECEGCSGEKGEAVTQEESQTGDQRRQDGEQSPGESNPSSFKLRLH